MSLSKVNTKFNVGRFLLFTFYHIISVTCSYFVAVPLIFIIEGFNLKTLQNLQFVRMNPLTMMDFMREVPFAISFYCLYRWNDEANDDLKDEINPPVIWDYAHIAVLILARAFVVGVKYGTFSDQYFQIFRAIKLPVEMLRNGLIFFMINMGNTKTIEEELLNSFKYFEIEEDEFMIQFYKDQKQFRIADSKRLMERLQDIDKLHAYYSPENKSRGKDEPPMDEDFAKTMDTTRSMDKETIYQEELMKKFEDSFKKAYSNKSKFYLEKIDKIMMLEDYVDIPAKNIALEIIVNNQNSPAFMQFAFITMAQFLIPLGVSFWTEKPFFDNEWHKLVFWLQFPNQLVLQFMMVVLFNSMN